VESWDVAETARRSGFTEKELGRLTELGILRPDADGRFSSGQLRRAGLVQSLVAAGIQLDGLGAAIRDGSVSLDFLDAPAFERFATPSGSTFEEVAQRIGAPVEQLLIVREATGSVPARPGDRMRDAELVYADLLEIGIAAGFRPSANEQMVRAQAEGLRRIAETEAVLWQSEIIEPAVRSGRRPDDILGAEIGDQMSERTERAVLAMYHLQQTRAWTANLIEGLEQQLAAAGLHSRLERPPAMCFIDLTGFTRLTQEHGDLAAADLAGSLGRIVQRSSVHHGGHPVKWLGDGVMLHFADPGQAVLGALEMVRAVTEAELPPAHVGLHAGPVIFQAGDYYGSTVNIASRISDHARPGQVLVSQAVVDAAKETDIAFAEVGQVELKGVAGLMALFEAMPVR
jgi:class 3 adenylate cyclase